MKVKTRIEIELVVVECYSCGVQFGVTNNLHRQLMDNCTSFYCPNGHSQRYIESTETRIKKEMQAKIDALGQELDTQSFWRTLAENRLRATKGAMTKLKKRVANGVCPCCHRQFVNLHRHMETKHPEFTLPDPPDADGTSN